MTIHSPELAEYVSGSIWLRRYPVQYMGCRMDGRMAVIRLANGRLLLHSPCAIDAELKTEIAALGQVAAIIASGTFHHLHIDSAQRAFPNARTWICPGIEHKRPDLAYDGLLGDEPPADWADELAFLHKPSRTLLLVDLIEYFTDDTDNVNWVLKFWWKSIFRMWNRARPAPEYQLGWSDKAAAKASLECILVWDFERIVLAHGDLIEDDAHAHAERAWARPLERI